MVLLYKAKPYHAAALLLLTLVTGLYYFPYLRELPTGIHTWAQSDRLALAINFYDYGFNFFAPRTSSLTSIGGITGVEFPLQSYIAALGGVVFGRSNIVLLFRLLNIAMVTTGFYYMFRLVYEHTGHFIAALVPAAFLLASPFFAFYAGSFMPDPFSLSLSFIGYYYWLRFFEQRQSRDLWRVILLLVLAGLIKTTTALHFGAIAGMTLLWIYLDPTLLSIKRRWQLLILIILGVGVIVAFFLHNQYLNEKYLSWQFRAAPNIIDTPEILHDVLQSVRKNWIGEYATNTQYRILFFCIVLFFVFLKFNVRRYLPLTLLLAASVFIAIVFIKLMGSGLGVHDYHMICSFVPPAMIMLLLALLNIGRYTGKIRYATNAGLGLLIIFLVINGYKRLGRRMSDDYLPFSQFYTHQWMRGGAQELQRARVPLASQILVVNDEALNTSLIYFDRRGITWKPSDPNAITANDLLNRMAIDSLDYVIIPPDIHTRMASQDSTMERVFEAVGQKPAVVLRRRDYQRSW